MPPLRLPTAIRVAVIQSAVTMLAYGDRIRRKEIDPSGLVDYWIDRIERLLRACVRDRELIPAEQSTDISFHHLNGNEMEILGGLYATSGTEMTADAQAAFRHYLDDNPPGQARQPALRPARTFRPDTIRGPLAFRVLFRPLRRPGGSVSTYRPLYLDRPGAEDIVGAGAPAREVSPGIWMSPGLSNSFMLATDDGRIVLNTGMGFEGPVHRANYDAIDPAPIRYVILTQGHVDHVGGLGSVSDPDSQIVAQAEWKTWRRDNDLLAAFARRTRPSPGSTR